MHPRPPGMGWIKGAPQRNAAVASGENERAPVTARARRPACSALWSPCCSCRCGPLLLWFPPRSIWVAWLWVLNRLHACSWGPTQWGQMLSGSQPLRSSDSLISTEMTSCHQQRPLGGGQPRGAEGGGATTC